uniref:Uncharacterized protein n=1 Tax=Amphimedon queenslandica TaxID=400682 RepID=A0A1X7VH92_AMPQE
MPFTFSMDGISLTLHPKVPVVDVFLWTMICNALPVIRHNEACDITAALLSEVFSDLEV